MLELKHPHTVATTQDIIYLFEAISLLLIATGAISLQNSQHHRDELVGLINGKYN